jgi:GTP-binding protein HflX
MQQVEAVLRELESDQTPRLLVVNKIDLLPADQRHALVDDDRTIHVSAKTGVNLGGLLEALDRHLPGDPVRRVRIRVPQSEGKVLAMLEGKARILSRQYVDGAVELDVDAPESLARRLKKFQMED